MNKKQRATLTAVFDEPVRSNVASRDREALLVACGAEMSEGSGSRVRIALGGMRAALLKTPPGTGSFLRSLRSKNVPGTIAAMVPFSEVGVSTEPVRAGFHRPHPRKEANKGAVRSLRRFLIEAGIKP